MAVSAEPQIVDLREPTGWRRTKNRIVTVPDGGSRSCS